MSALIEAGGSTIPAVAVPPTTTIYLAEYQYRTVPGVWYADKAFTSSQKAMKYIEKINHQLETRYYQVTRIALDGVL